jgi:hypothetical protein
MAPPVGKWLYFSKQAENHITLWKMPVSGGEEIQIHPAAPVNPYEAAIKRSTARPRKA